jgi:hypothetical protein
VSLQTLLFQLPSPLHHLIARHYIACQSNMKLLPVCVTFLHTHPGCFLILSSFYQVQYVINHTLSPPDSCVTWFDLETSHSFATLPPKHSVSFMYFRQCFIHVDYVSPLLGHSFGRSLPPWAQDAYPTSEALGPISSIFAMQSSKNIVRFLIKMKFRLHIFIVVLRECTISQTSKTSENHVSQYRQ